MCARARGYSCRQIAELNIGSSSRSAGCKMRTNDQTLRRSLQRLLIDVRTECVLFRCL